MSPFKLQDYLSERQNLIDRFLLDRIPKSSSPTPILFEAMRYSLEAGGKRLRPILVLSAWEACKGVGVPSEYPEELLRVACTLEMIHTYSLIHDDLPAMDNDDLRRGRPTSHKVFGEATAILAGDALLTEAFAMIAGAETNHPHVLLKVIRQVADASGVRGMAGGQALDLKAEGTDISPEELEILHRHKTGRIIHVACVVGGELAEAGAVQLQALDRYGEAIGLAFQIADDILDIEGGTEQLGKTAGVDAAHDKRTYPSVLGMETSKKKARELIEEAIQALHPFGDNAQALAAIAHYIVNRKS